MKKTITMMTAVMIFASTQVQVSASEAVGDAVVGAVVGYTVGASVISSLLMFVPTLGSVGAVTGLVIYAVGEAVEQDDKKTSKTEK